MRRITMWLPRWRATTNPRRSSLRTASLPEIRGSLGTGASNLERGHERLTSGLNRELFEIELCRLSQVGQCLWNAFTLSSRACLRIERHETAFSSGNEHRGERHECSLAAPLSESTSRAII